MIFDTVLVSPALAIAQSLLNDLKAQLDYRVEGHKNAFNKLWRDPGGSTPDEILAAMGTGGAEFVDLASLNIQNIAAIAAATGQQLTDLIEPQLFIPLRLFVYQLDGQGNRTGIVTLEADPNPDYPQPPAPEEEPSEPEAPESAE